MTSPTGVFSPTGSNFRKPSGVFSPLGMNSQSYEGIPFLHEQGS